MQRPFPIDGGVPAHVARYHELCSSNRLPGLSLARVEGLLDPLGSAPAVLEHDEELAGLVRTLVGDDGSPQLTRAAALAFGLLTGNRAGVCSGFPYDGFWSLSLARAVAVQTLSAQLGVGRPEALFVSGLLLRVGAVAFAGGFPRQYGTIAAAASVESLGDVRPIESEQFGLDHIQLSHALLDELGLDDDIHGPIDVLGAGDESQLRPVEHLLLAAERIASLCIQGEAEREAHWLDLVDLRRELGLERDVFTELGDTIVRRWWDWGEQLKIRTRALPSFYTLDHTAVIDRRALNQAMEQHAAAPEVPEIGADAERPLRILVVDDDPMAVILLQAQLERVEDHEVLTASNGAEALEMAQKHTPDVVVCDWVMPEMDGLDLCRALRRCDAGRNLYFVLLTGREEDEHVIEAFEAGVDDFVTKPSSEGMLLARMNAGRRVLELRQQIELDERLLRRQLARMSALTRQAREAALTDSLTELPNRRYATRRLNEEWASTERSGRSFSFVMLDVDHFKQINDTYGHEVGDDVLRSLADVLESATRQNEIACRFGGEEFVVLCSNTGADGARACAERIRSAVEAQVGSHAGLDQTVTVSIGVATRVPAMQRVDDLVRAADEAVYRSKAEGRNRTSVGEIAPVLPADPGEPAETADPMNGNAGAERSGRNPSR